MVRENRKMVVVGAALSGLAAPMVAVGQDGDVQAQIEALQAEVAQLRAEQDQGWLNERRAEEVKSLVREVLADAETRASLMEEGLVAGHDGSHFFLASPDDAFLMEIAGQLQFRYIYNTQDDRDEDVRGFQLRRTKINFSGYIADPKLGYDLTLAVNRDDGAVEVEDAVISYAVTENLEVLAGQFKLPFLRQELISSKRQLAADRALATEYFTLDRSQQVQLAYGSEAFKLFGAFSDGGDESYDEFTETDTEYAFTGRLDVKLSGEWDQAKDTTAWEKDDAMGLFLGAAAHYEATDEEAGNDFGDTFAWTADALWNAYPFGVMGAVMGAHSDPDTGEGADAYGVVVEGGVHVTEQFEPFARWNWIDADGAELSELQAATVGFNYYFRKHRAKFTLDAVWLYDAGIADSNGDGEINDAFSGLNQGALSDGLGLLGDDAEDELAVRAQFQLLF